MGPAAWRMRTVYATLLSDARFHELLLAIDRDLADACRTEGCQDCGGRLHSARYTRKPQGRPKILGNRLGPEHDKRFSFCCALDGCRARETPPSVRFLGRRVFIAAIVVLIAVLQHGANPSRGERLDHVVRIDKRTVQRWRGWWRETFPVTRFWHIARASFMPPVDHARLPAALLDRFAGDPGERLIALLRFLGPLTGGAKGQVR